MVGCSLLLAAMGILFVVPVLLVAAMAPMAFVAYSALTSPPVVDSSLDITRTVSPERTSPGGTVGVRLTVENSGQQPLAKLRLVDGVPEELSVVDGSPRAAVSLRRGESVSIEYTLRSRYGTFEFSDVTVRAQSLSAGGAYTTTVSPDGETTITATLAPVDYPGQSGGGTAGEMLINRGNEGLEFFGIRSYQPTDPIHKINWRRYAKDRELTTIDYRDREVSDVLVVVDARESAGVARGPTAPTGTELCVYVANEVVNGMRDHRTPIGVAALGVDGFDDNDRLAWVLPGNDRTHTNQLRSLLDAAAATVRPETEPAASDVPNEALLTLIRQLRSGTHVLFISPLGDDQSIAVVRKLRSTGYTVSACVPDVTTQTSVGGQVAATRRSASLTELRKLGVNAVDWQPDDPLDESLRQALRMTRTTLQES
ncbi:hypothetical protein C494_20203 [Natronorubrum bangense JCM 10635]|uniref:DUF11 domain-containing protein n=2 Tax=Natronorubrum bangense TaxID=61858 RepID=L9W038_9EURY|nr:hypothetical protein C494_20203 [Natronorubrum bangense JCM 10635]